MKYVVVHQNDHAALFECYERLSREASHLVGEYMFYGERYYIAVDASILAQLEQLMGGLTHTVYDDTEFVLLEDLRSGDLCY